MRLVAGTGAGAAFQWIGVRPGSGLPVPAQEGIVCEAGLACLRVINNHHLSHLRKNIVTGDHHKMAATAVPSDADADGPPRIDLLADFIETEHSLLLLAAQTANSGQRQLEPMDLVTLSFGILAAAQVEFIVGDSALAHL